MPDTLRLEIVTPQATVFSEDVHMVTLPAVDGEIGRVPAAPAPHHAAGARRGDRAPRTVRIDLPRRRRRAGGRSAADRVSIATDMAIPADGIDEAKAEEARERARARLQEKISDEEVASVNASLARSLAQLQVRRAARRSFS